MALTYTPAGELGSLCPEFSLPSVDGRSFSNADFASAKSLVVLFLSGHCPYVQAIEERVLTLAREMQPRGVAFVAISSNDPSEHHEDSPGELFTRWREKKYPFPYLIDSEQIIARRFGAVCTPDLYAFDSSKKLCYRGRLDDSWRAPEKVSRQELREALEQLISGRTVTAAQNPSMGCSIKWKKG